MLNSGMLNTGYLLYGVRIRPAGNMGDSAAGGGRNMG